MVDKMLETKDICSLLELNKKKAELDFKKGYCIRKGMDKKDPQILFYQNELNEVSKEINNLKKKVSMNGLELFYPYENTITELNNKLKQFSAVEIDGALETKKGEAYSFLEKRGKILKDNFNKREEIAVLIKFVNALPSKIKKDIIKFVKAGQITSFDISTLNEKDRKTLFKLLNRAGIFCVLGGHALLTEQGKGIVWEETKVRLDGNFVWVDANKEQEIIEFNKELWNVGNEIQLTTAQRQIKKFNEEEDARFVELQKKYLLLLKKRDEFNKEINK